ncbi:cobalt ABC transporter ATP-binding protein [Alkalihalobacillus alcalophilus ATCC 27647 = CGMCC 1.3604]|uniref:Cobalt ABC transporter ATP-binding protein n=1 Tax=Alkalihalobacillus alcalophilus ATCC 27647 = CGMCC 1.3604 TaxID=1218173 RepID=J8TRX8_ALKAL|nr:energy-coupling factor transporter ATPase [Alkalihalobacillus alcalophilus]AFV25799.1 cobalt ion transporter [Alkalihalobacillus alcalophilus ATCC 27647 = CGMCC 1.3604]KGA98287.1 cobalt transporter ATP-binding subunit [Alkalihalobacillus alcalophilus ATCC 27647 = CGMCC 1.3604]MED1561605.1 energy-coupling factor transporter ATPase [Alkalihalobacillus alcalophilus]THG89883.1 cobalt ABC transporter ATP-binding protein [Alkalihalobacillus alcalophilus ATCC 27647 = CGMCC 1.3604]
MNHLILFDNVTYQYDGSEETAINELSLSVEAKEWVAIVGRNGSGKSTLGRLMNGLNQPTEGAILIDGLQTSNSNDLRVIRQKVGMIFQNPEHQFVATTVRDDIAFGLENQGLSREIMVKRIAHYAKLIGVHELMDMEPHRLSGGQKQRVAICGVLALEPEVLIFDEATSMLDPNGREEVLEIMRMLNEQGITIISITHDMKEAAEAERMIVLDKGKIIADKSPLALFQDKNIVQKAGLRVPFIVALQEKLQSYDRSVNPPVLTEEELIEALWTLSLNK